MGFIAWEGTLQHGIGRDPSPVDSWAFNGGVNWGGNGSFRGEGGLLAAQWMGQGEWLAAFSRLRLDLGDFQEVVWRPYFQKAGQDGTNVLEFGNELDYHLNMAGLLECQFAGGWSHSDPQGTPGSAPQDQGFIQNMEIIDVLGMADMVFAFRQELPDGSDPFSNVLVGVHGKPVDEWVLRGDIQTAAWRAGVGDWTADLGTDYSVDPKLRIGSGYVHETLASIPRDGVKFALSWDRGTLFFLDGMPISLQMSSEALWDQAGNGSWDYGGRIQWEFFTGWAGWAGGRKTADQPWWTEIGLKIPWPGDIRSIISVSNLSGLTQPVWDLYDPPGVDLKVGVEGEF